MSRKRETAFARDTSGLPAASPSGSLSALDGESIDLAARPVRLKIGETTAKMFGYNGSIPGPTLHVRQGSEAIVQFRNEMDVPSTVHWHGLRHDNRFDGVPYGPHHGMQRPVEPGDTFSYRLRFPDPGVFWYHPHIREDYGQEHGLYGAILVDPTDPAFWAPVDRTATLILDDILIEDGQIAAFDPSESDHTLMGRYGNVMLINGDPDFTMSASAGDVVRLYIINAANTRTFDFAIANARMKLVGGDNGRVEKEQFIDDVVVAPSERAIVDVLFDQAGVLPIEHRTPDRVYQLGRVDVEHAQLAASNEDEFWTLRQSGELARIRRSLDSDLTRSPDKSVSFIGTMGESMDHNGRSDDAWYPIEWEDTMPAMNRMSTPATMGWAIIDDHTGERNMEIDWNFQVGERVKLRITNSTTGDHPMQHPFHVHGQRFLVLGRSGAQNDNLVWKDTVLVPAGDTVDVLVEATNPGRWMAHCHIAEHLEGGMMLTFEVKPLDTKSNTEGMLPATRGAVGAEEREPDNPVAGSR